MHIYKKTRLTRTVKNLHCKKLQKIPNEVQNHNILLRQRQTLRCTSASCSSSFFLRSSACLSCFSLFASLAATSAWQNNQWKWLVTITNDFKKQEHIRTRLQLKAIRNHWGKSRHEHADSIKVVKPILTRLEPKYFCPLGILQCSRRRNFLTEGF